MVALARINNNKHLNLSSNKSQSMGDVDLESLGSLDFIVPSRNLIQEIQPGTFLGMSNLKGLDFSVNVVRKVCDSIYIILTFF